MTDRLEGVAACVFDAYGTLFDVHSAVSRFQDRIGPRYQDLSAAWRKRQLEYTWLHSLMRAHLDFWQLTENALMVSLAGAGIEDESLKQDLMQAYRTLDAFPEVQRSLQKLKQAGIPTAILSNGTPDMIDAAVQSAGLDDVIDHQLSIEAIGVYKPDPGVYQLAVDTLGVPAAAIAFQSSNSWDAAGAAHFGFQVVWVNRYSQPVEALPGKPSVVVPDLSGLPQLLGF